eukprot:4757867-Pyramimonas_sp.AAC.1
MRAAARCSRPPEERLLAPQLPPMDSHPVATATLPDVHLLKAERRPGNPRRRSVRRGGGRGGQDKRE